MKRFLNILAQRMFDLSIKLTYLSAHASIPQKLFARLGKKILKPCLKTFGNNRTVYAHLFGYSLAMPTEHPLPAVLAELPQYNRPLGLAIEAIAAKHTTDSTLGVIDVGANIGDTIALIEQKRPGICSYLCIEADKRLAEFCRLNHSSNSRVWIKQCFIGEKEGTAVWLQDDGCANPSTQLALTDSDGTKPNYDKLIRLDTAAREFVEVTRSVRLIKVDTEGYDFSVLRSAQGLLTQYKPSIYFEWYPQLLMNLDETVWGGFHYLASLGYRYFVFFTNKGDYYCKISDPDLLFIRSLSSIAFSEPSLGYFDVFASTEQLVCDDLVEASILLLDAQRGCRSTHNSRPS